MPISYRIDINSGGGNQKPAYSAGNIQQSNTSLNTRKTKMNSEPITQANLSRVLNVGLAFNLMQRYNEVQGAYTNDRLRQRKGQVALTFAKYGLGLALNPAVGAAYIAQDIGYRSMMHGIKIQKQNREAEYYRELSGNNSHSGRRYKGSYL